MFPPHCFPGEISRGRGRGLFCWRIVCVLPSVSSLFSVALAEGARVSLFFFCFFLHLLTIEKTPHPVGCVRCCFAAPAERSSLGSYFLLVFVFFPHRFC